MGLGYGFEWRIMRAEEKQRDRVFLDEEKMR